MIQTPPLRPLIQDYSHLQPPSPLPQALERRPLNGPIGQETLLQDPNVSIACYVIKHYTI